MVWGAEVQSQIESYQKLKKWYLMHLINAQYYKAWSRVSEASKERSSDLPYTSE